MNNVRTRFAPSPTGYIHIGNVRAALTPFLIAKHAGGTFILRIEDTDRKRYVPDATNVLMDTLSWLGLSWDEGPIEGSEKGGKWLENGDFGPYFQTERQDLYLEWAKKLIEKGRAYADPYTPEEVQAFREAAQKDKKAFLYRNHRPENPPEWKLGLPLRFKTEPKAYAWHDEVFGDLTSGPEVLDDIILIKSDGLPTYNFAHIIDDMQMQCSHVTRGMEYLSSMPNYMALYDALDITPPKFVHIPHIRPAGGGKKLGKRDGAKGVREYRDEGYLPEAIINFLALMGWNDGSEQEIFSMQELIEKFEISRVQKSPANFNEDRLLWLNGQWIRRLSVDELYDRAAGFFPESAESSDETYQKQVLAAVQDRLKVLGDLKSMANYFFEEPKIDLAMILENKFLKQFDKAELVKLLETTIQKLEITDWESDKLQIILNELLEITAKKPAELFSLLRIAMSYAPFSPALNDTMAILGKEKTLTRLKLTADSLK